MLEVSDESGFVKGRRNSRKSMLKVVKCYQVNELR